MGRRGRALLALTAIAVTLGITEAGWAAGPKPGTPGYIQRDNQNMLDAYGRQTAPDGQLTPKYIQAQNGKVTPEYLQQVADQAANPTRPILDPGQWFPGWNGGNPYRKDWNGRRGQKFAVSFTNRYGALLRGDVYGPLPGVKGPFPAVVITTGSIQGSEKMYEWLAEDLAERGYVVITYDVQGQGTSETLPHQGPQADIPWCDPTAKPAGLEENGCPGVPFQQTSNFVYGTEDALDFLLSTPDRPYKNPAAGSADVNAFNPLWRLIDRRPDTRTVTPGRTSKVAIIGHSLGAAAVSYVQGVDKRVEAVVALDKLTAGKNDMFNVDVKPVVPGLGVQSEYGFNVEPYWMMSDSFSIQPQPHSPSQGPDPQREEKTGFDGWRKAGVDSMVVVPRASTHLEYTDISYALPASRYGQDVGSHYTQAWLDKYLKHDPSADGRLLATKFTYLEPVGDGKWSPVTLNRADRLSFYFCTGFGFHSAGRVVQDRDVAGVGGC